MIEFRLRLRRSGRSDRVGRRRGPRHVRLGGRLALRPRARERLARTHHFKGNLTADLLHVLLEVAYARLAAVALDQALKRRVLEPQVVLLQPHRFSRRRLEVLARDLYFLVLSVACEAQHSEAIGVPSEAIRGHQRPSEASTAIKGHQRPSKAPKAIKGHQRPSEALRGHQRPSKALRAHQRLSEALT